MKPRGRSPKPLTEKDLQMIQEYLNSDKSLQEIADKYGIPTKEGVRYKVNKYRDMDMQLKSAINSLYGRTAQELVDEEKKKENNE